MSSSMEDVEKRLGLVSSGDVILMNRKCFAMKDPIGLGLCLLTKTENRFDHVGLLLKISKKDFKKYPNAAQCAKEISPSDTYVFETNMKGVTLYTAEKRVFNSSSNEIATRSVRTNDKSQEEIIRHRILENIEEMYHIPYEDNMLNIVPSIFSPPDKMDRADAAMKIMQLQHEVAALERLMKKKTDLSDVFGKLKESYTHAQLFLLDTYFSHLTRSVEDDPRTVDWSKGHFWIDGENQSKKMVCSELITNLWQRSGLTIGFFPASSNRPFDLLDDERFNFVDPLTDLGELTVLKAEQAYLDTYWSAAEGQPPAGRGKGASDFYSVNARLRFLNTIRAESGLPALRDIRDVTEHAPILPAKWMIQSLTWETATLDLWFRLFSCGVLFSLCALPTAPLYLLQMEKQMGLFLVRGSMWSLACGVFLRGLFFSLAQSLAACVLLTLSDHPHPDNMVLGRSHGPELSRIVEFGHPFYTVASVFCGSAVCAHICSAPFYHWVLSYHFGPLRPGPVPWKMLCRGSLLLSPFAMLLPLQGYWLAWYETIGSLIVPTRSSVLRPREDLLQKPYWPHCRFDALVGAFLATLGVDMLTYPLRTANLRALMKRIYFPQASPVFGYRTLFPGFGYRLVSNAVIFGLSSCALHTVSLI